MRLLLPQKTKKFLNEKLKKETAEIFWHHSDLFLTIILGGKQV